MTADGTIYKGHLYYVGDSSIRVICGKNYNGLPTRIVATAIEQISFKGKNTFFKSISGGIAIGILIGILIPSKLYDFGFHISDKSLVYSMIGGAGLGLVEGVFSSPGVKIVIPINGSQRRFEENKPLLKVYSIY
ncbi:MAG: hypothetical protein ABIS01_03900 [Ferruginibacter sp.]